VSDALFFVTFGLNMLHFVTGPFLTGEWEMGIEKLFSVCKVQIDFRAGQALAGSIAIMS
jgi:hypothetical protein